jgi:hypothetical protein
LSKLEDERNKPRLIKDLWDAILEDGWMWIVVWGKPRSGKSTVQMKCAYEVYKDWDLVLQSFVYNLAGILYKMNNGIPTRITTRNMLHNRVPILLPDDFGATGNKAKTQHEPAWDIFKGTFDTLATKIGVLMASMGTPTAPTQQLQEKYTHEIYVPEKGTAKYDVVGWQQNYSGWQPKQDKNWIETFDFSPAPLDVYKEYDVVRMSLVDELVQLIQDSMAESQVLSTIRRLQQIDIDFMETVQTKGLVSNEWINRPENQKYKDALMRGKARSLIVPVRKGTVYYYDLTDLGLEVLTTIKKAQESDRPLQTLNTPKVLNL